MYRIFFLLLPLAVSAQTVNITSSPIKKEQTQKLYSRRFAKAITPWIVTVENQTDSAISIGESAVIRLMFPLNPVDRKTASRFIDESAKNGAWARIGRVSLDLLTLAAFYSVHTPSSQDVPKWGIKVLQGITSANALGPYLTARIKGVEPPLRETFEDLSWSNLLTLQPGESGTEQVYTQYWKDPTAIEFKIDTSKARATKIIQ